MADVAVQENAKAERGLDAVKKIASTGFVRSNLVLFRNASLSTVGNTALAHDHHHDHDHVHAPVIERNGAPASAGVTMEYNGAPVSAGVAIAVETEIAAATTVSVGNTVARAIDDRLAKIREARVKGYEGDSCGECGNFTLVRNGTCMKCTTCGSTSGCS